MTMNRRLRLLILFSAIVLCLASSLAGGVGPETRSLGLTDPTPWGAKPRVVTFVAEPPVIGEGGSTTLIWVTENALSVSISDVGEVALSGRQTVRPMVPTTYKLSAVNAAGETLKTVHVQVMPMLGRPAL